MHGMQPLVSLRDVSLTRGGVRLIGPITWQLERGHHVALVGGNGAGKTTLLKLLRGDLPPDGAGKRVYDFGDGPQHSVLGLRHRIASVSADMQDFYFLHARRVSGRSVILSGFFDTPLLYEQTSPNQEEQADAIIDILCLHDLAVSELGTLSTGQVRKLLVARALVSSPDVLCLDECLDGLDINARAEVLTILEKAAARTTLVCAVHRIGDMPRGVDHAVVLDGGRIVAEGDRIKAVEVLRERAPESVGCDLPAPRPVEREYLLRMRNVSVVVDGTRILHAIHWTVLPGEQWLVMGGNGAGKSTLLRLITSEIAPYADEESGTGTIERLGGLTMDTARPRIGVVSPALQAAYARELGWEVTALEAMLSGYRGSVGMLDEPTSEELLGARRWLARVGLADMADRSLRRLSYGQQRRIFLARAMAPGPELLLLDEPFSGLDPASREQLMALVQGMAEAGVPMVLVTHHLEDRIPAINRVMYLEQGRIRFCGTREEYESALAMG